MKLSIFISVILSDDRGLKCVRQPTPFNSSDITINNAEYDNAAVIIHYNIWQSHSLLHREVQTF